MAASNKELIAELRFVGNCESSTLAEASMRDLIWRAADALEAEERDAVDLKLFRGAVEAAKRYGERLHAEGEFLPEQYDRWDAEADRLLAIIDANRDAALPAPPKKED